jgi:ABC-type nitrate/sulfonate/bicarbonate transport system permease component
MNLAVGKPEGVGLVVVQTLRRIVFNRRWVTLVVVIIVWQLLTLLIDIDLFPTPMGVLDSLEDALRGGLFFSNLGDSMVRISLGSDWAWWPAP